MRYHRGRRCIGGPRHGQVAETEAPYYEVPVLRGMLAAARPISDEPNPCFYVVRYGARRVAISRGSLMYVETVYAINALSDDTVRDLILNDLGLLKW